MWRPISAFVLLAHVLAACTTWKDPGRPVVETVTSSGEVRVTMADGRQVMVQGARIVGDSLVGVERPAGRPSEARRVAYATSDVARVEVNEVSASRTGLLVLGIGAAVFVVLLIGLGH